MKKTDLIDEIVAQWAREMPKLDSSGFAVVGRVLVLAKLLERRIGERLSPLGLNLGTFDVLATLRRQGAPHRLTPTALSRATMLTTGAMTNRLDRLEQAGLVARESDPADRRGLLVSLTPAGLELVDQAIALRFDEALDATAELSATQRDALAAQLRRMLLALASPGD